MWNKRLRQSRINKGFTQQFVATNISIALRTYQCYEQGTRQPSYDTIIALADLLDISIDWLFCRDTWLQSHNILTEVSHV